MKELKGDVCGRPINGKLHLWEVAEVWHASESIPSIEVPLGELANNTWEWFGGKRPTTLAHRFAQAWPDLPPDDAFPLALGNFGKSGQGVEKWQWIKIMEADLSFPIIISAEGWIMDGTHRIATALLIGRDTILAKRFSVTPEPGAIVENNEGK